MQGVDSGRGGANRERAVAVAAVLLCTVVAVLVALRVEHGRARERLRSQSMVAAQATRGAVDVVLRGLRGTPALVDPEGRVDLVRFDRFADGLQARSILRATTLSLKVADPARDRFERRFGTPILDATPAGRRIRALPRNQYEPVVRLRPASLGAVLGYDVLADPARATAVHRARDVGAPQLSRPVILTVARSRGLIAYAPLYRPGAPLRTVSERRRALIGVVGSSFEARQVVRQVLRQLQHHSRVRILDRDQLVAGPVAPLRDSEATALPIAGRRWVVSVASDDRGSLFPAVMLGIAGLVLAWLMNLRMSQYHALKRASTEQARLYADAQRAATAREEALRQTRYLAQAGSVLDASLDLDYTLQALADLLVPEVADWCAVSLMEGTSWDSVAVAHSDPAKVRLAEEVQSRWPPEKRTDRGVGKVLRTGEPELIPVVPDKMLTEAAQDEEHLAAIRELGLCSAMMVPLVTRGRILGALTLISDNVNRRFDEKDLAYAAQLAQRAALSVDNAQLHARTVATAQTLQAGLLPAALPDIPGVALAARYHPVGEDTEVGGDFYDVHALENGGWAVTVGDVCGKGPEAAALTALIRYTLRVVADDGPAEALRRLNEAVLHQRPDGTFATLVHIQVTPAGDDLRLCVACAGHPAPVIRRSDGSLELIEGHGPIVGAFAGFTWPEQPAVLRPGDALAMYTDGVLEAADQPLVADELLRLLRGAPDGANGLADRLEAIALEAPRAGRDDVAVLVLERTREGVSERAVLRAGPEAPGRARAMLEPHLGALPAAGREAARLLVTETVTNAVRHGGLAPGDAIEVRVRRVETRLRVEVRDRGRGMREVPPKPAPGSTGGYGLHLVEELSDRWGWTGGMGTCVWFELEEAADPEGSRPASAA